MKVLYVVLLVLLLASVALAQPPDILWSRTYGQGGGGASEFCRSVQQTADGGFVLAGYLDSGGMGRNFWLLRSDASGDSLWSYYFGGTLNEICFSVQQTADGGYILGGNTTSYGAGGSDFWLVKTDSNGNSMWNRTFGGSGNDTCFSVQQTADGGYALAGGNGSFGQGNRDFWLVKTDTSGNSQWSQRFGDFFGWESCNSVRQTIDRGYILGGYTTAAGGSDFWLVKTDSSGNSLWSRTFGGNNRDECRSVQQTADGGYILAGFTNSFGSGESDFWLVKTDANGDSLWTRTFGGSFTDVCQSVQQTADGGYILVGYTTSFGGTGEDNAWVVRTNSSGDSLWSLVFAGSADDVFCSVQQTTDCGYILGGYTASFPTTAQYNFWLVKTGPDCYGLPASPVIRLATIGDDARLYWSRITEDTFGCPISITHHLVYYSPTLAGPYDYLDNTADTTYTHADVVANNAIMFYIVTATTAPLPLLARIPRDTPRAVVEAMLREGK